jgi:hypothetical protein
MPGFIIDYLAVRSAGWTSTRHLHLVWGCRGDRHGDGRADAMS